MTAGVEPGPWPRLPTLFEKTLEFVLMPPIVLKVAPWLMLVASNVFMTFA